MTVGLCLIAWNEIEGCKHDVPLIDRSRFDEVICVDGGSTDGTVEYLRSQGVSVYPQSRRGLNQACKDGVHHCSCDAIVFFHPKATVPVEDIYKFRNYFEQGYEFVVASRMMKESENEEDGKLFKPRKWFVLGLGLIAKVLFKKEGNTIWDTLHGFRGIMVKSFEKMSISDRSPSVDIEMVCRSYKFRMKRTEFPTKETPRTSGNTHFNAFSTGMKLLRYICWEITRKE